MNRKTLGALLVVGVATLTSCVREARPAGVSGPVGVDRTARPAKLGERVRTEEANSVTVFGVEAPTVGPVGEWARPDAGHMYAAIDVEACAGPRSHAKTGVSPLFFVLETEQDTYAALSPSARQPGLLDTALAPNGCARGWISFQVPERAKLTKLSFFSSSAIQWELAP